MTRCSPGLAIEGSLFPQMAETSGVREVGVPLPFRIRAALLEPMAVALSPPGPSEPPNQGSPQLLAVCKAFISALSPFFLLEQQVLCSDDSSLTAHQKPVFQTEVLGTCILTGKESLRGNEEFCRCPCSSKAGSSWGAWVAQSVKRPTLAQVTISRSFSLLIVVGWARLSGLAPLFQACTHEEPLLLHLVSFQRLLKGTRDGLWGRVRHESAPVTQGLENARVGEMVSHLWWAAGAEVPGRKKMGAEARKSRLGLDCRDLGLACVGWMEEKSGWLGGCRSLGKRGGSTKRDAPPLGLVMSRVPEAGTAGGKWEAQLPLFWQENSTFNALPLLAALQTANVVKELKKVIAQKPEGLRTLAEEFPGWEAASRWSQALEEVEQSSRPYLKEVQRYEKYRWILGCVLCSAVLLVVVCNLLGLNLGIWGLAAREDPGHSEAKGEAGARFLMMGVGFSFLLAAPLILLVFATFLVGGNVQTLVCRSWESRELYKFADTPGNLPPSMNLSQLLGLKKNISILLAYQQCKEGAALWSVLQLNDSYDLEKHLNISQYTAKLQQELQNLKIDMKNLDLLSPAAHRDLEALQSSGLENIHYSTFLDQIQKPVVNTNVEKLAQELEGLARTQGSSVLGQQLQEEAQGLKNLYQEKVLPQQSLVVTQHIATCQPLSRALDNGRVILCDMIADPWNAFWFCLAWCTFFLIPSIIFAVKTSKYFRPIWKRLSSTSSEETQLFRIPRVTSLRL
ncbi:prominin-2-like [Lynx pardinus]|uniref:Prominin-2-like n=1 Tax=Lynx pardinus TaxID=191816 RepID=A0A485MNZ5_LYNPA|nr:prominin-2-like [Lynx pardinus]